MDKQTLSHYGWIVVVCIIISLLLAFAAPFGNFTVGAFESAALGFTQTSSNGISSLLHSQGGETKFENGLFYRDGELANEVLDSGWEFIDGRLYKDGSPYTGFFEENYYHEGYKDNYDYELYYDITLDTYYYRVTGTSGDGYTGPSGSGSSGPSTSVPSRVVGETVAIPSGSTGSVTADENSGVKYTVPAGWTLYNVAVEKLYGKDSSKMSLDEDGVRWKTSDGYTHYFVGGNKVELANALSLNTPVDNNRKYTHVIVDKTVDISYNPSLRLYATSKNIVVFVEYLNQDAIDIYSHAALEGKALDEAIKIIINLGKESGKLNSLTDDIEVFASGKDSYSTSVNVNDIINDELKTLGLTQVNVKSDGTDFIGTTIPGNVGGSSTSKKDTNITVSNQTMPKPIVSKASFYYKKNNIYSINVDGTTTVQDVLDILKSGISGGLRVLDYTSNPFVVKLSKTASLQSNSMSILIDRVAIYKNGAMVQSNAALTGGNYELAPIKYQYYDVTINSDYSPSKITASVAPGITVKDIVTNYMIQCNTSPMYNDKTYSFNGTKITVDGVNYTLKNSSDAAISFDTAITSNQSYTIKESVSIKDGYAIFTDGASLSWQRLKLDSNGTKYGYCPQCITDTKLIAYLTTDSQGNQDFSEAFFNCKTIKRLYIKDGVTDVECAWNSTNWDGVDYGTSAIFTSCSNLEYIYIPASLTSFPATSLANNTFNGTNVSYIDVAADNPNYKTVNGVLFSKDGATILCYPVAKQEAKYIIPSGVSHIGPSCFANLKYLTEIVIPEGIVNIPSFEGTNSLQTVTLPKSTGSLTANLFKGLSNLTRINYGGTADEWNTLVTNGAKGWNQNTGEYTVYCSDGTTVPKGEEKTDDSGCIAEGTLVTLADGTQKPIEKIKDTDMLLIYNHETGKYDKAKVNFIEDNGKDFYNVINLKFSDGTTSRIIYEHGFFDLDLMKYVYINEKTYKDYIGHRFYKDIFDGTTHKKAEVVLTQSFITNEYVHSYGITSEYHLNTFTDNLLSMEGCMKGAFNIFAYEKGNLQYNQKEMAEDIAKYGLLPYEKYQKLMTRETFDRYPAKYLQISIAKGLMTEKDLAHLVITYVLPNA